VLLGLVDACLQDAGISLEQLSYIAVVHGPGSFTGVRIAVSVAQGLAYGLSIPVLPVTSLDTLAFVASKQIARDALIVCALDARMQEVYWSAYRYHSGACSLDAVHAPSVSGFDIFRDAVSELVAGEEHVVGVGSAFQLGELDVISAHLNCLQAEIHAEAVIAMIEAAPISGSEPSAAKMDVRSIQPFYLRNHVAWQKRKRVRENPLTSLD
jgi:tRNA threonylcarbamoyladenosine biosynthesis protein TsaB